MLRNRPILVVLGWIVVLGVVYEFLLAPVLPHSWLSYSTRPLWDKSEAPVGLVDHFERPGLEGRNGTEQWCELHGWKARKEQVEVWDATIFSTELDLLLLRLHELSPTVNKFFLLESSHSFTGIPRDPLLATALESDPRFAPFSSQIDYYFHQGRTLHPHESPFAQEIEVRQAMDRQLKRALNDQPAGAPAPVMVFADVDELPRRATVELLKSCDFGVEGEAGETIHLGMREYVYSYGWEVGGETASWRASATVWKGRGVGEGEFYRHGKQTERVLVDSGWHCSWCFRTLAEFATKAKGYSHVDRLGSRPSALLRPSRIQKTLCEGTDMFRMLPEAYTYRDLVAKLTLLPSHSATNVPTYLREHPDAMPYLLPGGCMREDYDPST